MLKPCTPHSMKAGIPDAHFIMIIKEFANLKNLTVALIEPKCLPKKFHDDNTFQIILHSSITNGQYTNITSKNKNRISCIMHQRERRRGFDIKALTVNWSYKDLEVPYKLLLKRQWMKGNENICSINKNVSHLSDELNYL